jgi:hypothetical protein
MRNFEISPVKIGESKLLNFVLKSTFLTGVLVLIVTLFYLLFHLETSDKIFFRCIPGFMFGLFSILAYGFLYANKKI